MKNEMKRTYFNLALYLKCYVRWKTKTDMSNKKMNLIDDNKQFRNEVDKQSILTKDKKRLKPKLKSFPQAT